MRRLASVLTHPDIEQLVHALGASKHAPAAADTSAREATVAVILRTSDAQDLELLMIQRAEFEGDPWSGNVALPGGHREPDDASLEDAVIRETHEETGIDLTRDGKLLGRFDPVRPLSTRTRRVVVIPFLAAVAPDVATTPGPEVAAAFWIPLASLRQPELWDETTMTVRGERRRVHCFRYDQYLVWGMTERILRQFIQRLPSRQTSLNS